MKQCPTCGTQVPESATVCTDCGTEIKSVGAGAPPSPEAAPPPGGADGALGATVPQAVVGPPPPAVAPVGQAQLTLRRGGILTTERFALGDRVVIGRFDQETGPVDVDLAPLPEATYVSRRHAELWRDDSGQWHVKDLGSRNGTFVKPAGQSQFLAVTGDQAINDGDEVALGNASFAFHTAPMGGQA